MGRSSSGLPFELVCLNTNLYFKSNDEVDEDEDDDPLGQFAWLEVTLEGFRR